jgi:hypothetical protein
MHTSAEGKRRPAVGVYRTSVAKGRAELRRADETAIA